MRLNRILGFPKKTYQTLRCFWSQGIYYIPDKANWSFYWDAHYITSGLKEQLGLPAYVTMDPWSLRKQIIHFGNRYAFFTGPYHSLHPSNYVFLTWFHGNPADPNPNMQRLFVNLKDTVGYVQKVVVTCQISRQILIECEIPPAKLVTIPLGVDLARFSPPARKAQLNERTKLRIPRDTICIGYFQKDGKGWDDGYEPKSFKGPDIFLDVIANLSSHYNNLFILLTGPARGYIKQGLEKLGVPYVHHFLSDYYDIVRYYQALDIYIITSRDEGGPKALLESWATGVPVVSTRVGMPADLIRHGENGMLSEIEDVKSLVENVRRLIEDEVLRNTCIREALVDVKEYDWPLIAKQYYEKLYRPFLS